MDVVVTGAGGFIGHHVTALLAALPSMKGRRILAVDRFEPLHDLPRVVNVRLDLVSCSETELERLFASAGVVIHLAALVDTRGSSLIAVRSANLHMTERIARCCCSQNKRLERFVFVSSVAALQPELSPYGQAKADAEKSLRLLVPRDKLVVVRPHIVYGSGDPLGTQLIAWTPRYLPVLMIAQGSNRVVATDVAELAGIIVSVASHLDRPVPIAADDGGFDERGGWSELTVGRPMTYGELVRTILGRPCTVFTIPLGIMIVLVTMLEVVDWFMRHKLPISILRVLNRNGLAHANTEELKSYRSAERDGLLIASWGKEMVATDKERQNHLSEKSQDGSSKVLCGPHKLGPGLLRNRVIKAATYESMSATGLAKFHARIARGGVGLTVVSYGAVADDGKTFAGQPSFQSSEGLVAATFAPVVEAVHSAGGAVGIQLTHAGAFADTPRPVSARSWVFNPLTYRFSSSMTPQDEQRIEEGFRRAVTVSCNLGFDAVEIHCGHGYLLSQCLTAGREDFVVRIVEQACVIAHDRAVAVLVKMNVDGKERSVTARWMRRFCDAGADALVPSGGHVMEDGLAMLRGGRPLLQMAKAQPDLAKKIGVAVFGPFLIPQRKYSDSFFRRETLAAAYLAGVPLSKIALVGGVQTRSSAARAIGDGFGFVCMGRALLRDPDMLLKTNDAEVRRCDQCNRCIVGPTMKHLPLECVTSTEEGIYDW